MKIFKPYFFKKSIVKLLVFLYLLTIIFLILGLYYSIWRSPADYQQGNLVRIMYVHVPCAWMSILLYSIMTFCSILYITKKIQIAYFIHISATYVGSLFTALTLITGSLWARPTWGSWWVWDARLTSVFILFLFYVSNIMIIKSNKNIFKSSIPSSIFTLLGFINIPIVKFSVNIWNGIHQKSSIFRIKGPLIDSSMLIPLTIMGVSFFFASITLVFMKTNNIFHKSHNNYINKSK
ncbi:MAG: cytochrome c biogenesis protein CcsA [Rickettsia sp.]|nr:cytochrome c biogenesis protein CcsA [Rickettsia sp.]